MLSLQCRHLGAAWVMVTVAQYVTQKKTKAKRDNEDESRDERTSFLIVSTKEVD